MAEEETHWRCVLSTGDDLLLGLAKSILDAEKILYVVEGELLQDLVRPGRIGLGFNQVAGPMEVWVSGDRAEEAVLLLKDLRMDAEP